MATNVIQICEKCKHMSMKTAEQKLRKAAPDAELRIGCKSYCGPCARYAFVFINGRYVKGKTEDEAIENALTYLKTPKANS